MNGVPSDQIATSGPYSEALYGVSLARTKVDGGVYTLVVSPWEKGLGVGGKWEVRVWTDGPLEVELVQ
jgi:hypothetical protein